MRHTGPLVETATDERDRILLTGATGYVGGRLLARLEREQHPVRCLTRRPHALAQRVGATTEVVAGDLLEPESLLPAMREVRTAYYLVHSMDALESFEELDRRAATNFATAAQRPASTGSSTSAALGRAETSCSPRQPPRGRQDPQQVRGAHDRVAGLDSDRCRQRLLRDGPGSG